MKKGNKIVILLIATIMTVSGLILTACTNDEADAKLLENSETLVVIEANATGGSMEDAMAKFKKAGNLDYEGSVSEFGFYLISVGGYTPDASKNEFWAVYTTLGEYEGVAYSNVDYGTYEYNGKTCASAAYGISGLPLVKGNLYILTISTY